ncbi:MAG: cytochrome c3 family protein, partial [Bdellovibrionales bacterium]|nr:cytochrome c3 family protein [Bdellovibrionales bacterium]
MDLRHRIKSPVAMAFILIVSAFLSFAISFETSSVAQAQESEGIMNRMFAPGPLMEGHKQLEGTDCLKCHDAGKGISQGLCLDCHKEIKVFVDAKKGFHGLATKSCIECHSDHKGRSFDSTVVDTKNFDHKQTGYVLEGKHAEIDCVKCHETKRIKKPIRPNDTRYLGKQTSCVSCHKKDDIHFFTGKYAKKDCNECHGLKEWKTDLKFDHKRDTGYELRGKHAEMKCLDCHGGGKEKKRVVYKWPQLKTSQCLSCHEDQHKGNFSKKFQNGRCTDCHTENEWKIPSFNHKITGYPLRGKHAELNCTECHKQTPAVAAKKPGFHKFTGLSKNCLSCHDDEHRFGKFKSARYKTPNNCLSCHNETHWKKELRFDHNLHSRFAINGRHGEVSCEECHLQQMPLKLEKSTDGNRSSKKSAGQSTSPFVGLGRSPAQAAETKGSEFPKLKVGVYHWNQLQTKTCEVCHGNPHLGQFSKKQLAKKCTDCHTTE